MLPPTSLDTCPSNKQVNAAREYISQCTQACFSYSHIGSTKRGNLGDLWSWLGQRSITLSLSVSPSVILWLTRTLSLSLSLSLSVNRQKRRKKSWPSPERKLLPNTPSLSSVEKTKNNFFGFFPLVLWGSSRNSSENPRPSMYCIGIAWGLRAKRWCSQEQKAQGLIPLLPSFSSVWTAFLYREKSMNFMDDFFDRVGPIVDFRCD